MNPSYATITTPGTYYFLPDYRQQTFELNVQVIVPGGVTASYGMNYTLTDPNWKPGNGYITPAVVWLPSLAFPAGSTASLNTPLTAPVAGLQLVVASVSGGAIYWNCLQGDFVGT